MYSIELLDREIMTVSGLMHNTAGFQSSEISIAASPYISLISMLLLIFMLIFMLMKLCLEYAEEAFINEILFKSSQ